MDKHKILLVDDDLQLLDLVGRALEFKGYQVTKRSSGEAALEALVAKDFDLVITDFNMGETDGIAVLKEAKKLNPETMVIIFTGSPIDTRSAGADDYLFKPCGLAQLYQKVESCLRKSDGNWNDKRLGTIGEPYSSPSYHAGHSTK